MKTVAGLRKTKLKGLPKVDWAFTFAAAAYNLVRAPKLAGRHRQRSAIMLHFTALERAALEEIWRQQIDGRQALESQLATATVTRRENSGVGFFTYLAVDRAAPPVANAERVLGNVAALIEGFKQPLLLMLFMNAGCAEMLEGAAIDDSTVGIDLSTLRFKLNPA
jgi:hypothetical protein